MILMMLLLLDLSFRLGVEVAVGGGGSEQRKSSVSVSPVSVWPATTCAEGKEEDERGAHPQTTHNETIENH